MPVSTVFAFSNSRKKPSVFTKAGNEGKAAHPGLRILELLVEGRQTQPDSQETI